MKNQLGNNVVEFPAEYLMEQSKLDRWLTMTSCSIVMGSDEPMAYVDMILDKYAARNPADTIAYLRFAALPDSLTGSEDMEDVASMALIAFAATENVFNEWIDAWLPAHAS